MVTTHITTYCHDFGLVPKIYKSCVAGNRNHCSCRARTASAGTLVHRGGVEKGGWERKHKISCKKHSAAISDNTLGQMGTSIK